MEQLLIYTAFGLAFSFIGYKIGRIYGAKDVENAILDTVDSTVTKLIGDGYIRTVGEGDDELILKWWDENTYEDRKDENEKKDVDIH